MASSNPFLFGFISLIFFFFFIYFENKSFASAIRSVEESELQLTNQHRIPLSSLFPSSSCTSHPQGGNRNGSLEVVHKHGPCSKLNQPYSSSSLSSPFTIPHSEILHHDKARVMAIQSKLSKTHNHHHQAEEQEELDRVQVPANSAIPLGRGNYYVTIGLGSPKKFDLSLELDTGSVLTWTQCKPCLGSCYTQKDLIFDPSKSSSYSNIPCPSSLCSRLSSACYSPAKACLYGIRYGDGSSTVGFFAKETLTISSTDVVQSFLFGCGQSNRGIFTGTAGLLGLGRSPVSLVEQTAGKYGKIFSYCLPSTPATVGYLNFGGGGVSSGGNVKYISLSSDFQDSSFYGLDLVGIEFAGVNLPISASLFSSGTIIDSGTVISRLPPKVYGLLREAFEKFMSARYTKGDPADQILDTCYDLSGYSSFYVPSVSLVFGGGVNVELAGIGVVYVISQKQVCLGFAANENDDDVAIIGNTQQKTIEVLYDVGGERIGFRPRGCN